MPHEVACRRAKAQIQTSRARTLDAACVVDNLCGEDVSSATDELVQSDAPATSGSSLSRFATKSAYASSFLRASRAISPRTSNGRSPKVVLGGTACTGGCAETDGGGLAGLSSAGVAGESEGSDISSELASVAAGVTGIPRERV